RLSHVAARRRQRRRARCVCRRPSRPPEGACMNRVDAINRGVTEMKPLESVEIPSLEGKVSDEEWAIRVDLAAAYRMIAYYGWDDLIFTHLSALIPGPEHHVPLNPYN